jgi:hypothetical protein
MSNLSQKADECAKLAAGARTDEERARQLAMEDTWRRLHHVEQWLDQQISPFARATSTCRILTEAAPGA